MNLIFIRHGEPDYERDSLTEKGWREADLLAERLEKMKIDEVYCSPLGRAADTAAAYLKRTGKTAETLEWLQEFPGTIQDPETGKDRIPWDLTPSSWTAVPDLYDKDRWLQTAWMQTGTCAEIYASVIREFETFLAQRGYVRNGNLFRVTHPNTDTVVFFCHFGITSVLVSRLLGISPLVLWQGFIALPTSLTVLSSEERAPGTAIFRCNRFGDLSHFDRIGEPASFAGRFPEIYQEG